MNNSRLFYIAGVVATCVLIVLLYFGNTHKREVKTFVVGNKAEALTTQDLRDFIASEITKTDALIRAGQDLRDFQEKIAVTLDPANPASTQIDPDQLVANQGQLYANLYTGVETAADALGTDGFH